MSPSGSPSSKVYGLQLRPLHYQVHPVVLAQGRMPDAMEDAEVRMMKCRREKDGNHAE